MNIKKRVVLMSGELATNSPEFNKYRTDELKGILTKRNYNFTQVQGSYKGVAEVSFLVDASEDIINDLLEIARFQRQDSILVVNEDQKATLIYNNGQTQLIGTMTQVDSIKGLDAWTLVNNMYFSVK